ncbi:MAG TPA: bifunctional lysine ketoglutarate reductase /saccharopine dehydrogenase family protein, partial [Bacteroidales bacterium]|nr:bifunctional lysine ketoglutarate reductase /saccharopine dehydrogenase family protein [Bacteroidales bacterium]
MNKRFGIRHEDKYLMERRVPVIPAHVRHLREQYGLEALVQGSGKRIFSDQEFLEAGARVMPGLPEAPVIFGVKEVPIPALEQGKTYVFFSHVIKGQSYNMPMLKQLLDLGCTLIDYEKVADETGKRLIFFGRYAGLAGMINTLWALGLRLEASGIKTPFLHIRQACTYASLQEARRDVIRAGQEIAEHGLPKALCPFIVGVTGYGNVSNGAQEILSLLPVLEVEPDMLEEMAGRTDLPSNLIYRTTFREHHLSAPNDPGAPFDLQQYYRDPSGYHGLFHRYLPTLSLLVNGMYWDARYPRLVTRSQLQEMYREGEPRLRAIGDITCDIDGSIESTVKAAPIEDPIFVYDPFTHEAHSGCQGRGIQMMTVDILPSELPREASEHFSAALLPFLRAIVEAD